VLHVGLPKTGTTSLQQLLWANRESLQTADVHLVVPTMRELFDAARDLTRDGSADWRRLVDAVRQSPGTVVLSCEGLSAVPAEQARRALADLRPADVRVVCTLRDPARVLPSVAAARPHRLHRRARGLRRARAGRHGRGSGCRPRSMCWTPGPPASAPIRSGS